MDVPLDAHALRFDFFLSWARRMGMLGCWQVFACELHAAVMCAFRLDEPLDEGGQLDAIRTVVARYRNTARLIETSAGRADPVQQWRGFYELLWAGRLRLGGRLDLAASRPLAPAPWGVAKVGLDEGGIPFPLAEWFARTTFHRAMYDIHATSRRDDWDALQTELRTTLDSIWCLSTRRLHLPRDVDQQRICARKQHLEVLLATARQHFDPAVEWDEFRESLWMGHHSVTRDHDH